MGNMIATRESYGNALAELGKINENVVVFDADLSGSTKTAVFRKAFPERHFNAGIAEMNMAGMAAGMAACGKIPFISTFAVFGTGRIYDAVRNAICYPKLNVKLAMTHAGLTVGEDGATHQMLEDVALMSALPNMTVIVPADDTEAKQVVFAAAEVEGPVYMRFGRGKTECIFDETYKFEIGKAKVISEGKDVAIFACGIMVAKALRAAEMLREEGIEAEVVNVATIKPLDKETIIEVVKKTGCAVTCEEHSVFGGLNSAVAQCLVSSYPVPLTAVAVNDTFGESGKPDELLEKYGLTAENIVAQARKAIALKG